MDENYQYRICYRRFSLHKEFYNCLHGSKDEIHDKITGVPNSFQETIAGIQNLKKLDVSIVAKIVISKDNATDLVNIMALLNKLNVNEVNIGISTCM